MYCFNVIFTASRYQETFDTGAHLLALCTSIALVSRGRRFNTSSLLGVHREPGASYLYDQQHRDQGISESRVRS